MGLRAASKAALVALALVAMAVLVACGSDDDSSSSSSGTDTGASAERAATDTSKPPYVAEGPKGPFKLSSKIAEKLENGDELNITMSLQSTTVPIFSGAMQAGFDRGIAAVSESYPVNGEVIGPKETDYPAQVSQITQLVNADRVDCLVVHAAQPGPFVGIVNQAMAKGIPVFGVNADTPDSARFAFYTINEYEGGKLAAKVAAEQIEKQGLDVKKAALVTGDVAGPWAQDRMRGFMEGMKEAVPDIEFKNDLKSAVPTTFEPPKMYAAVRSYLTGNDDVDLVFSTDQGVEQLGKAIKDLNKEGDTYAVGFNVSPAIIKDIEDGRTIVSVAQAWNKQAQSGAEACGAFLLKGEVPTPPVQELPAQPITKDNAAEVGANVEDAA